MRKPVVLLSALLLVLLVAVPVAAKQPDITIEEVDSTFDLGAAVPELFDCGDFSIWEHDINTVRTTTFYDKDGNPNRLVFQYHGTDYLFNPDYPDDGYGGHWGFTVTVDLLTGEWTASGIAIKVMIPGYGPLVFTAGHYDAAANKMVGYDYGVEEAQLLCSLLRTPGVN